MNVMPKFAAVSTGTSISTVSVPGSVMINGVAVDAASSYRVTVNSFITVFNEITWDIHGSKPFTSIEGMKDIVAPMYDQAYAALIERAEERRLDWIERNCEKEEQADERD